MGKQTKDREREGKRERKREKRERLLRAPGIFAGISRARMCTLLFLTLLASLLLSSPPPSPPPLPSPPLPTPSLPPPPSTPSRRSSSHRRVGKEKKREHSRSPCDSRATRRTMTAGDHTRGSERGGRGHARRMRDSQSVRKERANGKSEREVREDGARMVCQDIAARQKRFGALLAASRRVEKPEAPGKTRFPN